MNRLTSSKIELFKKFWTYRKNKKLIYKYENDMNLIRKKFFNYLKQFSFRVDNSNRYVSLETLRVKNTKHLNMLSGSCQTSNHKLER